MKQENTVNSQKLTIEDLEKITQRVKKSTLLSEGAGKAKVTVHMGTCGIAAGAAKVLTALKEDFEKNNIEDVILTTSGCAGMCCLEPMITVELKDEAPVKYVSLNDEKALQILSDHVLEGNVVAEYSLGQGYERILGEEIRVQSSGEVGSEEENSVPDLLDVGFFGHQTLIALKNRGMIDPEKIDEYIARGGYSALAKALTKMSPEDIVNEVTVSGLRGRGGGGFPAGRKWASAAKATGVSEVHNLQCG